MLFGMIAAIGIRTLAESKLDFTYSRNLMIVAIILIIGLGVGFVYSDTRGIPIQIGAVSISISGLFMAVVIGVILNLVLPQKPDVEEKAGQKAE